MHCLDLSVRLFPVVKTVSTSDFTFILDVPLTDVVAYPSKYIQSSPFSQTFVVCRLGNDSQIAAEALRSVDSGNTTVPHVVKDLVGGLRAWSKEVDPEFPMY